MVHLSKASGLRSVRDPRVLLLYGYEGLSCSRY
jgi:hypothetical protein